MVHGDACVCTFVFACHRTEEYDTETSDSTVWGNKFEQRSDTMTDTANTGPEPVQLPLFSCLKPSVPGPDHKIGRDTSHLSNAAYAETLPPGIDPWDVRLGWNPASQK